MTDPTTSPEQIAVAEAMMKQMAGDPETCPKCADSSPPDFTIRSNDGNYEFIADAHVVRDRQRLEDSMEVERREAYRERTNKRV